ncbi:MAG: hypothetical protein ABR568_17700 [Pyrinomonadaceae bacterium]
MFRFYPKKLLTAVNYVATVARSMKANDDNAILKEMPTEKLSNHALDSLNTLKEICKSNGLDTSASLIEDALGMVTATETWKPTRGILEAQLNAVRDTVYAEVRGHVFLRITKGDQQLYEQDDPFGEQVASNFSDAKYDIGEASKCLALNRGTACVTHLMRALELGLNSLANHFQVSFTHVNWNQVIEQIENKIKAIDKDPNKPTTWKDDRKFYSEAANQFRFFKDSWRNYSMHVHEKYTPEEALIVYTSVKVFMEQISKRLKQP